MGLHPKAFVLGGEAVTIGGAVFRDAAVAFALHALLRPVGHDNGALRINPS